MSTVVLLHGFAQTGASWAHVADRLQEENYRVVAPDIRGHGSASTLRPISFEACVDDLRSLTSGIEGTFTLVGYSMGGRLALHAALAIPERIGRLVLIGATAGIEDPIERKLRKETDGRLADLIERTPLAEFAREWAENPLFDTQSVTIKEFVYRDRLRSSPTGLAAALRGIGTGTMGSLWGRLSELAMPVEIVAGELDTKFLELGRRMASKLKHAKLTAVPECGHATHLEEPETVSLLIKNSPV